MELFVQLIVNGLAIGSIYGSLALGMVLVFRATGVLNFAQGEMALICTYIVWQVQSWGVSLPLAIVVGLVFAFAFGALVEVSIIRRIRYNNEWGMVILTFGLFLLLSNVTGYVWGYLPLSLGQLFPSGGITIFGAPVTWGAIGTLLVVLAEVALLTFLLQRTKLGLGLRATVSNQMAAGLVGINVRRMGMLGWAIAAVVGAVAGILAAPTVYLEPGSMFAVLLYALAAAALGGFDSLSGAFVAALIIGVLENLASTYIAWIGSDLKIAVPLAVIFAVLVLRPSGLFGSKEAVRV